MPVVHTDALDYADLPGRRSADPLSPGFGDGYAVRLVQVPAGPRTPHLHPHSDELTFVVSGEGTAWEDDVQVAVGPGDLIVVPRGVPHATIARDEGGLTLLCFFPRGDLAGNLVELPGPLRE